MQVERPSTFDGIDTTHIVAPPSPLPPPPQQQQQQPQQQQRHSITINSRGDEAPAESLSRFDSTNSEDDTHSARTADSTVDPNRKSLEVTARRRRSHQRQPKSPGTGKDQSSRPGSVLIDDDSTSSKGQSSRECQRVPSWRSGSKRAARLRQGEKTSSQQPSLSSSSSHYSLEDDCESLRVTLPLRVTTGVTMTAASGSTTTTKTIITTASPKVRSQGGGIAAGTLLNLTGSAGEQDVVVVRGLQSPGWKKRAKVQNGSGEALSTAAEVADESGEENSDAEGDDASDEMTDLRGDGHPATAASGTTNPGSRRGSQTLHHYYHGNHHHHGRAAQPSSPGATTRGSHQTHTRNFSSPSLLDSFTSPEPMLSPIQSYFGSDPNSPASSFSLPRHDHYSRLTIDPAASMDGYHGFATHPWSEQSTTPSRAFSHRWTRRLSQSDAFAVAR
ncbi:hypothetical protein BGZ99_000251 [Dissophora globulifera]|uniref:Uncharacterized protein n=1 Tax=Dissophora globulifera TaxID=979702 RepID=A0A9P6RPX4_9FUNG|nr:hypothetical protein BGZ99_000251 [Dissophora globulifera]